MSRKPVTKAINPVTDSSFGYVPPSIDDRGLLFKDVGSTGLRQYGGWVREEFLQQLQGRQGARVYREMLDNSSAVGAIVFAIQQTMRDVEWRVIPADQTPEAIEKADWADSLRGDMSHSWEDFVVEALSMIGYGYAPHEIVYKKRLGRNPPKSAPGANKGSANTLADTDPPTSIYDDGTIGIRRLPLRGQDTVLKWFFGQNGEIQGVTQQPWMGPLIDLPIEKMLLFRPMQYKNNPEGRAVIRNSYRPYYFLKRLEEMQAINLERMSGVPALYIPSALWSAAKGSGPEASAATAAIEQYKKIVSNVRQDEQMGVLLPSDTYRNGDGTVTQVKMFDFQLVSPASRASADFQAVKEGYRLEILTTVLADFIALGHGARGTQALATSKIDIFYSAVSGWLASIAAVLNRYMLPRLWELNGWDFDTMPSYQPDLPQRVDLDGLSMFIFQLSQAGITFGGDPAVEGYLRDVAGLPDAAEEGVDQTVSASPNPAETLKKILRASLAKRLRPLGA
jgi:hypothetical protein